MSRGITPMPRVRVFDGVKNENICYILAAMLCLGWLVAPGKTQTARNRDRGFNLSIDGDAESCADVKVRSSNGEVAQTSESFTLRKSEAPLLELNAAPDRRLRMSELGQRTVLSRTRVSRVVDELAAAGLAERQPDQADGRSSFAALTPAGREALRRAWPVYRQAIHRQLTARLTPRQCRELAELLGLVIATDDLDPPVTISG